MPLRRTRKLSDRPYAAATCAFVAFAGATAAAMAQPVPPLPPTPRTGPPAPIVSPGVPIQSGRIVPPWLTEAEAEAFRRSMSDYERCTRDKAAQMRLSEAATGVISVRDRPGFWQAEFARNATLQQRFPRGYGQMLAETFSIYRTSGGTAATVDAVTPVAPPCTNPWETYRRPPSAPITERRSMPVPASEPRN